MQIPVIKKLVANYNIEQLFAAETALLEETPLPFEVVGKDEGEKLTHILAAIEILKDMQYNDVDEITALRNYFQRVRNSIS